YVFIMLFLVLLQASQFVFYFNQNKEFSKDIAFPDYQINTVSSFASFSFQNKSCLLPVPIWNFLASEIYYGHRVKVLSIESLLNRDFEQRMREEGCESVYIIEQTSIVEETLHEQYNR